jgi:type IX secretion system PorP/SprF family membrane protein
MKLNKYILIAVLACSVNNAIAQQQAVYTNFLINNYYYNPAIAGSRQVHVANLSYRNQWAGFEGAPVSIMGSFYGSHRNQGKHGYGALIMTDKAGLTQRTGIYANYAYHLKMGNKVKMGLGIQPGYVQYRITLYDVRMADLGDDVLTGNILSQNAIDLNGGFHVYSDKFFVMGSVSQLLGDAVKFTTFNPSLKMHYTAIAGYNIMSKKKKPKKTVVQPAIMMKYTSPVPPQFDFMLKAIYNKKIWGGLTFRTNDAASICIGYDLKERYSFGYSFDYSISGINRYQSGTHEIVMSFVLTKNKPTLDQKDEELNNSIMDEMKKEKHKEELEEK